MHSPTPPPDDDVERADEVAPPAPTARVRPDTSRAVVLTVGVAAAVAFVALRLFVQAGGYEPLPLDLWWQDLVRDGRTDIGLVLAWIPDVVGGTIGMIVIGAAIVIAFLLAHRKWDAIHIASAIVVVVAIGAPLAAVIARDRPETSLAEQVATSFPSGHTAVATTFALTLALIFRHWWVWVLGVIWALWMAWSRTYLEAHWLSDVIAGLLEGIAVAAFVWAVVEAVRDRRARRSQESAQ